MGWLRKTLAFWVAALALSLALGSNGIREDELECEEAIAHLVECCPRFAAASVKCEYDDSEGCKTTYTALSIAESRCIERRSCDDVRSSGLCTKVSGLLQPIRDDTFADAGRSHERVCP